MPKSIYCIRLLSRRILFNISLFELIKLFRAISWIHTGLKLENVVHINDHLGLHGDDVANIPILIAAFYPFS